MKKFEKLKKKWSKIIFIQIDRRRTGGRLKEGRRRVGGGPEEGRSRAGGGTAEEEEEEKEEVGHRAHSCRSGHVGADVIRGPVEWALEAFLHYKPDDEL